MRCKPGELCVVIGGNVQNIGAFLRVVPVPGHVQGETEAPDWAYEDASRPLVSRSGTWGVNSIHEYPIFHVVLDRELLPIRWPEGEAPLTAAAWRQVNEEATA